MAAVEREVQGTISMEPAPPPRRLVYRHRLTTRLWHWANAVTLLIMLMSGLMIFNAHPRLYWGSYGANMDRTWFEIGPTATGGHVVIARTIDLPTGGVLGRWKDQQGVERTRAFPWWSTIPSGYSLAAGRRWHLSFAWVLVALAIFYLVAGAINRHLARDLLPRRRELTWRHIWHDVKDHARLRFPTGEAATRYNILQKLSYGGVVFLLIPGIILTGLTMSPVADANFPFLLTIFGGRQSARSIHFLCAFGLVAFTIVHLAMVVLAGPINEIRSMITGWFRIEEKEEA
jgi:thiosulfate reductase cytochrome b subunit